MATSGSTDWFLDNAGVITEAFARCGIRPTALTREHFISATRSMNLALQSWSNKGVNLFQVDLQSIALVPGQATYDLPSNTVNILDAYLETYSLQTTLSGIPNFSTALGSSVVTVNLVQNNLDVNDWINIIVPIAIGGLVLQGLYQVQTVLNANQFTIVASAAATSAVPNGGQLPVFTTVNGSSIVSVLLPNHGLSVGNTFTVQEATIVGDLPLNGPYIANTITDANNFTFDFAVMNATSNDTETENSGNAVIETQANSGAPIDTILTSISRTDYASQPDKTAQAKPNTFWFDRLSPIPTITLWNVPDGNGPYVFFYYRMRRIQDAYAVSGQTADIPYRFLDALCAELAYRFAGKYAPALKESLKEEMMLSWGQASEEDRERVQIFMAPDLSGYMSF